MPRTVKAIGPEAEAAPVEQKGTKTDAVKAALKANPKMQPKEIAELLQSQGWDIKAQLVSVVKSNLKSKKKGKGAAKTVKAAPAAKSSGAKDGGISLDSLKKAKDLAAQLGGINQAKAALAALSELLD
jgi:hypothetical protein